jgi:hypothetical protein
VQIAPILGVTVATIAGSFKSLYDDQRRHQKIVSDLEGFHFRTQDLKTKFDALSTSLKIISLSSRNLLDVWDDVAARLRRVNTVTDDTILVPAPQAQQLKNAWANVTADAKNYIDLLQSSAPGSSVESHRVITAKFNATPKVPTTEEEVRLHKLAAAHGLDALCASGPQTVSLLWSIRPSTSVLLLCLAVTMKRWLKKFLGACIFYNTKEARCRLRFQFLEQAPSVAIFLPVKGSVCRCVIAGFWCVPS